MNTNLPKSESLLAQTQRLLNRFDLRARKGLAQHFLIDREVLNNIVAAADLTSDDIVMEIGPGLGVLTAELVRQAGWVIAVELDNKLAAILKENLAPASNITVVNRDILEIEPGSLFRETKTVLPPEFTRSDSYKVVANLPYYITSAVLRHFLEATSKPGLMVIMVQKEIAQQIVAQPGDMSLLSNSVQFYGKPRIVCYVTGSCFYPAPKVDSAVLRIDLYDKPPVAVDDTDSFFRLVKAGFKANRKQIINSLSRGLELSKYDILPMLEKAGIDPTRRAETLNLEEWARLYHASGAR